MAWAFVLVLTAFARFAIGRWADNAARSSIDFVTVRRLTGGVLIAGSLTWGSAAGFLLATGSPAYQMFVGVLLAGVASVAVLSITAAPTIARVCVVSSLGPLIAILPFANDAPYTFAPFVAIWAAVLFVLAKRLHVKLRDSLTLEIENLRILDELTE